MTRRKCFWCGSKEFPRRLVELWSGKTVAYCVDGAACVRRRLEAEVAELEATA